MSRAEFPDPQTSFDEIVANFDAPLVCDTDELDKVASDPYIWRMVSYMFPVNATDPFAFDIAQSRRQMIEHINQKHGMHPEFLDQVIGHCRELQQEDWGNDGQA